ncbi:MAG TPA: hypothetical protein DCY07_02135 [Rhodospirillaceae bacterium]|nr:hypothetical protein [Rhodospirillaceae bacterium]
MARKTKEEAEKTRQTIMKSAVDVFLQKGVGHSSLQEIAEKAGVTRGAIYWHFKDKVDLLRVLADETFLPHEELLDRLAAEEWEDPLKALKDSCLGTLLAMMNDPHRRNVFTILTQRCEYVDEMQVMTERNSDCRDRVRDRLVRVLLQAEQKGQLGPMWIPQTAAAALHGLFYGFVHMEMEYFRPDRGRDGIYRAAIEAVFKSLQAGASDQRVEQKRSA